MPPRRQAIAWNNDDTITGAYIYFSNMKTEFFQFLIRFVTSLFLCILFSQQIPILRGILSSKICKQLLVWWNLWERFRLNLGFKWHLMEMSLWGSVYPIYETRNHRSISFYFRRIKQILLLLHVAMDSDLKEFETRQRRFKPTRCAVTDMINRR